MANIKNRPGVASPSRQNNVLPLAGHAKFSQPPSRKPARPRTGGVTPTGLEEWTARGRTLYSTLNRTQWEIGAWFNGGHRYGQRKAVVTAIGFDYHTAKNYGWVERKVERSRRRDLSFTHHEKVAALLPDDQVRWLDIAVRDKLSTTELELEIKKEKSGSLTADEEKQQYIDQLKRSLKFSALIDLVPPWEYPGLADYLSKHPSDSADLYDAALEPLAILDLTLKWLRGPDRPDFVQTLAEYSDEQLIGVKP